MNARPAPSKIVRCGKYDCPAPAKHSVSMMPGASVKACEKHLEWAQTVARTGRS